MKHTWTENDDLVALYLYLYKTKNLTMDIEKVALAKGIHLVSLRIRISNIQAIDIRKGLENFAQQTLQVYNKYNKYPESDLRKLAKLT